MTNKLFVGGISWGTTESALSDLFASVGTVVSASIITDRATGKSKGFGFVEMASPEEAQKAVEELNGKELDGRTLSVSEARPREPRENNGGGYNRGGNDRNRFDRNRDNRGGGRRY